MMKRMSRLHVALAITVGLAACSDDERPGKRQLTVERVGALSSAAIIFEQQFGTLPRDIESLGSVGAPYFDASFVVDGWGNAIAYEHLSDPRGDRFRFCSPGQDQDMQLESDNICSEWLDIGERAGVPQR